MLGNKILDLIFSVINLAGVLGGLGVFIYIEYIYKRPLVDNDVEFLKLSEAARRQTYFKPYSMGKMIINLHTPTPVKLRFLNVETFIQPFLETQIPQLEKNKSALTDILIRVAGKMEIGELNTLAGRILLEDRMKKEINSYLRKSVVKKIYFTTFVMQ